MRRKAWVFSAAVALAWAGLAPSAPPAAAQPGEAVWTIALVGSMNYNPGLSTTAVNQGLSGTGSGVAAIEGATAPAPVDGQVAVGTASCSYTGTSLAPESIVLGQSRLTGSCGVSSTSFDLSPLCVACGYNVSLTFTASTVVRVGLEMVLTGTCVAIAGGVTGTGTLAGALQLAPTNTALPLRNFAAVGDLTCVVAHA